MKLPINPTILPMLAKRVSALPEGDEWIFEPKWDGFRALFFRDGDELFIQSRDEKPLIRYFPELVEPLKAQLPAQCVLDGEIVIAIDGALEFDALQLRLHPAESRVRKLAEESPAAIVFFDVLALNGEDLREVPFAKRRSTLEKILKKARAPLHITPATRDRALASDWFKRFEGAGLDGVMAKGTRICYEPNKRVMLKVKHEREADCVVAGFRWHKDLKGKAVGSLLLGLFDDKKTLHHVGVCASFTAEKRRELVTFLEPYRDDALAKHPWKEWAAIDTDASAQRKPGSGNRWNVGKDMSWVPIRPELVAQVAYDHMQGDRFRHTAQFRRWRQDKKPKDCDYEQLEVVPPMELKEIFGR
jgi:ATP-dependent DNA ligase